ncbi:uncharacterized protein [Montipora capricornis]|uniref:uncharacterized protein isoform X2 n=1 Tax=Montipora capricornis TaxID=246305 RepID=UPI0035F10FA8
MRIDNRDRVRMSTKQISPSSGKNKILYQAGARLEAMDYTLNWYAAKICRVDNKERKVLIHFEGWNHRYDEWINFDSERLRPHARQQSHQDPKDEKDWKVGDRVLAKWQDCKFYPAKVVKPLNDGAYEVLFYDGIKKSVHRVNIKPDTRKVAMLPSEKLEHDKEVQERKERRQLMATARAERARKRSAEISPTPPVVPLKRKDSRNKKGKIHNVPQISGELPEVEEVLHGPGVKLNITNKGEKPEVEEFINVSESPVKDVGEKSTGQLLDKTNKAERMFNCVTENTAAQEFEQKLYSSVELENKIDQSSDLGLKHDEGQRKQSQENFEMALHVKEEKEDSCSGVDVQGSSDLSMKPEETRKNSQDSMLNITENVNSEEVKDEYKSTCKKEEDEKAQVYIPGKALNMEVEAQNIVPSVEENEAMCSYDTSNYDSSTSADLHQERNECEELDTVTPKLEKDNPTDIKPSDCAVQKIKTSKGPKIKRTLSKAERLSRAHKAKSGLTMKTVSKSGPVKVVVPSRRGDNSEGSLITKGTLNNNVKTEKTVQRRKSSKGSRSSSISPRGYGYSMAFMDIEKSAVSVIKPEPEIDESTPDGGLTDNLTNSTQSLPCAVSSPTSPANSTGTPNENQPAPKKQTYQAKKFRLDQITGKLSAQRQSEAQAAAHSPSAFQPANHTSPKPAPPNLSPSPPANQPPPYPRESSPPPGPPPLIYSPMPRSCCPTPHHQHMYRAHPGHRMHLPAGHVPPHPEYPPPSPGYMLYAHGMHYPPPPPPPGPCMGQCSCSAGVRQPVYHPLPPGATRPPHGTPESALAQLMQCEQRILHGAPGMPHYREAGPPTRPWLTHRHGPPPAQTFIPVSHHTEDRWHTHEEQTLQATPVSQVPPPASSSSPTLDNGKNSNRRSRKNERPLPTKTLPASIVLDSKDCLAPSAKDLENAPTADKTMDQQHQQESTNVSGSKPETAIPSSKEKQEIELDNKSVSVATCSQQPTVSSLSASVAKSGTSPALSAVGAVPGEVEPENPLAQSGFSVGNSKNRKGKEPAPKELVIEMDHNKYKCKVPGCDKSFRKESGLEYHIKYYHEQKPGVKRKKSMSVRSDFTPETSPEFGSRSVSKRRIHRSSAPAQLSGGTQPLSSSTEPIDTELSEFYRSITCTMDTEALVNQDTDLEIEGGGVEVESIDPRIVDSMEVEEEEDINGDVIRCLCNEIEEGGFMIQCEQCLTWQHSECVGLNELTVPPNYLCYVCTNPRGLRRSAKYKNDFDWLRRGTLACMPFVSIEEPEYTAELNLATHGLMSDLHDVNNCLRSLKLKFELLRSPSHPDLKYWRKPKNVTTAVVNTAGEIPLEASTSTQDSTSGALVADQGESQNRIPGDSNENVIINGHQENGHERLKQERPSTPPSSLDTSGDSNNNIHSKKVPLLTDTGPSSPSSSDSTSRIRTESGSEANEETSGAVKREEEPLSPIPALVPAGGQMPYTAIRTPSTDQRGLKLISNKHLDTCQPSAHDMQETGQQNNLATSGGSLKVEERLDESKTAQTSDATIKRENESNNTAQSAVTNVKEPHEEFPKQSLSDDEEIGAMNNLLIDINQMQDDMEDRMDEIERQLEVLEDAYGGTPSQLTKKTDFRKLVKDLSRVRRILQKVS